MSERTQGSVIVCDVNFLFFRADSPLPYWAGAGGHVVCPGMQQRAIQLRSNGMPWHHRPADCFPAVKGLPIFGVVGMNWLRYRGRNFLFYFFLKQTSLMPKLCVSVSVFQQGLLAHGRRYYVMPHVFPVTFSTDSPLLSLQNILTPTSTGPPLPSSLCLFLPASFQCQQTKSSFAHALPASEMMISFFL